MQDTRPVLPAKCSVLDEHYAIVVHLPLNTEPTGSPPAVSRLQASTLVVFQREWEPARVRCAGTVPPVPN